MFETITKQQSILTVQYRTQLHILIQVKTKSKKKEENIDTMRLLCFLNMTFTFFFTQYWFPKEETSRTASSVTIC